MAEDQKMISMEEAKEQLKSMITRTALIHYAFTKTIMEELGKEKGKALAKKAIMLYGKMVGKRAREIAEAKRQLNALATSGEPSAEEQRMLLAKIEKLRGDCLMLSGNCQ